VQTIYYVSSHGLKSIIKPLLTEYELIPLKDDDAITRVRGVVLASAARLSPSSPLLTPSGQHCLVLVLTERKLAKIEPEMAQAAFAFLPRSSSPAVARRQIESALQYFQAREAAESAKTKLEWQTQIMHELNRVGMALTAQRDTEKLLEMIMNKSRELTRSDAASLYLIEPDGVGGQRLRFKFAQNESVYLDFAEFTIPVSYQSIAGFVAETGIPLAVDDVYSLPIESPYWFNKSFDKNSGYHTKSMLVVPLVNAFNYVIGVLQLINHKTDKNAKINGLEAAERFVTSYPQDLVDVASSLGSQAAVALENSLLYQSIKDLFEGFVNASVTAIEQRDPTTSGHSFRVADLTVGLAELVDSINTGPFACVGFNRDQMTEIRYASLLHDFGKVGVREEVLVKAKKLYPMQLDLLRWRFDFYRRSIQLGYSQRKLDYLLKRGLDDYLAKLSDIDDEMEAELRAVDDMFAVVLKSDEPTVLAEGSFERLVAIAQKTFETFDGQITPLLTEQEAHTLSIPRGSLNDQERREIEQHAFHTFVFLCQIPWTEEWKNIPRIAGYHHEKLDGTGYPNHVKALEIPIQSRMMSISDIFDALTASDRPYKKAVPVEKALNIIESEVKTGKLDTDLFNLFITSKIYKRVLTVG
jgi:HD-GYP domain-containing protein (c-di-GMP phosphodiesterase class II)